MGVIFTKRWNRGDLEVMSIMVISEGHGIRVGLRHIGYEIMGVLNGKAIVQTVKEEDGSRGDGYCVV